MPPRAVRGFLERERLQLHRLAQGRGGVTALSAPSGYGKSSQLNHWRRETLARGGVAIWYTLDGRDEPLRLVRGLAHAAQLVCGKKGFDDAFMQALAACTTARAALAGWLAQVSAMPVEVVLLLDDVELLPAAACAEVLDELIRQLPANLHLVLAARPGSAPVDDQAFAAVQGMRLTESDLRFRPDETLAVLSAVLGSRCDAEAALGLQELTDGWPLGIQLAAAALHRHGDLKGLVDAATTDIRRYFVDSVIERQPPDAVALLVRLAQLDPIHPGLCRALFDRPSLASHLSRLYDETPLLLRAEGSDWMRLHPLAREVLRERARALPRDERQDTARRAAAWYASHELHEPAAQQCVLAGDIEQAIALVERTSDRMAALGRGAAVIAWYERLSPDELRQHPGLWAPAAWALSMGERHEEALAVVGLILAQPQVSEAARYEAALIAATADGFADRIEQMAQRIAPWPEPLQGGRADHADVHHLVQAFALLYRGHTGPCRQALARVTEAPPRSAGKASPVTLFQAVYCEALSYLWEGDGEQAGRCARRALVHAEQTLGRSHPVCCNLATAVLEAAWATSRVEDQGALLAGRMAALDRAGVPDALMSGYTTLARMAEAESRQDQALSLLETLHAMGQQRGMIRLQVQALSEMVSLHARHGRIDMAQALYQSLDALGREQREALPAEVLAWADLQIALSRAEVALVSSSQLDWAQQGLAAATQAEGLATRLSRTGDVVRAQWLQVQALQRLGSARAAAVLRDAVRLAQAGGMGRWLATLQPSVAAKPADDETAVVERAGAASPDLAVSGLLTTKEREVLVLLSRNLSNKEIARAMDIGEGTIKFHLKNLFSKLDAAGRRHAVARARQLGLVQP